VFIAGACHAPKDIPESVAQASAAAGKVAVMFSGKELTRDPEVARIDESVCAACYTCYRACPYHAIEKIDVRTPRGDFLKRAARVNPGLCMGCGTCVAICPSKSADIDGYTEQQIYSMVEALA
jgi:heterodisulfide reductase subunit A